MDKKIMSVRQVIRLKGTILIGRLEADICRGDRVLIGEHPARIGGIEIFCDSTLQSAKAGDEVALMIWNIPDVPVPPGWEVHAWNEQLDRIGDLEDELIRLLSEAQPFIGMSSFWRRIRHPTQVKAMKERVAAKLRETDELHDIWKHHFGAPAVKQLDRARTALYRRYREM